MHRRSGYDDGWRNARYDGGFRPPRASAPVWGHPGFGLGDPGSMPFFPPFAPAWGMDPATGWMGWTPGPLRDERPRVPPHRSPTYGRGGDRALLRWAERYGYDVEYTMHPDRRPRGGRR
jgi:hypothetical protein